MNRTTEWGLGIFLSLLLLLLSACKETPSDSSLETVGDERLSGGTTTIFDATSRAFSFPAPNLSSSSLAIHNKGDAGFEAVFITPPAAINPGLGPLFNNSSCSGCHSGDGRGKPVTIGETFNSILFRVSIPGTSSHGAPNPAPGFGTQLQDRAIFGKQPEASVLITYTEMVDTFSDGTEFRIRKPTYTITGAYQLLPPGIMISPRVAPPVFGLGLLEAINEQTILALSDEHDSNGDGISGRPNYVWDEQLRITVIGRFGFKANTPNLVQQTAAAYNGDIGITSTLFPQESSFGQLQLDSLHDDPEITDEIVMAVAHYTRTLAVPARRNINDLAVQQGKAVFNNAKCSSCHIPTLQTGILAGVPEVSNQTIHPYTDLLLHDMGDDLSDGRPDFLATGNEWRTTPLWGIGLTQIVNGHSFFLHDGRARNLLEAIMWHGGEAAQSREYVRNLSDAERNALIKFLESL